MVAMLQSISPLPTLVNNCDISLKGTWFISVWVSSSMRSPPKWPGLPTDQEPYDTRPGAALAAATKSRRFCHLDVEGTATMNEVLKIGAMGSYKLNGAKLRVLYK